jgi:cytochrome c6
MIGRIKLLGAGLAKTSLYLAFLLLALGSGTSYAADPGKGGRLYAMQCSSCHGSSGMMQPDALLLSSIKTGKNAMPAYRGILSDPDILDVIAYLRTLH